MRIIYFDNNSSIFLIFKIILHHPIKKIKEFKMNNFSFSTNYQINNIRDFYTIDTIL